jgi:hypothetical protein
MHGGPHTLDLGHHARDERRRQPAGETDELVLIPIRRRDRREIDARERMLDFLRHRRRFAHELSAHTGTSGFYMTPCYTDASSAPRSSERAIRARRPSWDPFE